MRFKLLFVLFLIPLVAGTAIGGYIGVVKGTPSIQELKKQTVPGTKLYADDNTLLGEISQKRSIHIPLRQIPENLRNAVIAVEDSRFYKHKGVDVIAIGRAVLSDLWHAELREGASTITQQLAKITFLSPEKTFKRKLREMALAMKIEKNLSKDEILELYLNRVYFGHGAYGVEMAAKLYFGKSARELNLSECALIAGIIRAPTNYSPFNNAKKAKERQAVVLERMRNEKFIDKKTAKEALERPLLLSARRPASESYQYFIDYVTRYLEKKYGAEKVYSGGLRVYTTIQKDLQAEAQRSLREGLRDVDKRRGWRGPLRRVELDEDNDKSRSGEMAFTVQPAPQEITEGVVLQVKPDKATLDVGGRTGTLTKENALWAQKVIDPGTGKVTFLQNFNLTKILRPGDVVLVRIKSVSGKNFNLALEQETGVEGAVLALDPKTGFIRAMVGGYDYRLSEFNRALYAKRQAGSSFKPVIYGAAIDKGYSPSKVMLDEPISYEWGGDSKWAPKNYDGEYWGPITLRRALAFSKNVVTVRLLEDIGIDNAITFAQRLGINSYLPRDFTLALGSLSITPIDLVSAYAPFANGGIKITPVGIKYVTDSKGRVLESNEPPGERVITPETAFLVTSMLKDVISYGTGWKARSLSGIAAGKTGTTNDYRDAWFIGYTPSLLAGVWVGLDDMKPLGQGETGSVAAAPVWANFMKYALGKYPPEIFEQPEGIVSVKVNASTGAIVSGPEGPKIQAGQGSQSTPGLAPGQSAPSQEKGQYEEYYLKGSEPPPSQPLPVSPEPEKWDYD
jgi:penicillin-binding protein 1A